MESQILQQETHSYLLLDHFGGGRAACGSENGRRMWRRIWCRVSCVLLVPTLLLQANKTGVSTVRTGDEVIVSALLDDIAVLDDSDTICVSDR